MTESEDQRLASNAVSILDATIRLSVTEANHMARWIFGSLFSLNMAGAAAGVALDNAPLFKLLSALCFLSGIFLVLLSAVLNSRAISKTATHMMTSLSYWVEVSSGSRRDPAREHAQESAIQNSRRGKLTATAFMWASFGAFVCGVSVIAFGMAKGL